MSSKPINEPHIRTLRWQGLDNGDREHLVLSESSAGVVAESVHMTSGGPDAFASWYRIVLDAKWNIIEFEGRVIGNPITLILRRNTGSGAWSDGAGNEVAELAGTHDLDLSTTPFTNTLPLRRCQLAIGQSIDLNLAYVSFPDLKVFADLQRYTRIDQSRYLFESVDSDFKREIEVDHESFVVYYPGLFARIN